VCLDVVVFARRSPGLFAGGGNLVRGAVRSVGDVIEAADTDDSSLAVLVISTSVESGLVPPAIDPILASGRILCGLVPSPTVPGFLTDCDLEIPSFGLAVEDCNLPSPPPVNLACAAARASSFSC
jgi:hypothetical protein